MDQSIGIGYQVSGVNEVVTANNKVISSFDRVVSKIESAAGKVGAFGAAMGGLSKSMSGLGTANYGTFFKGSTSMGTAAKNTTAFKTALDGFPRRVYAAFGALNQLTTAVQNYNSAMRTAKSATFVAPTVGAAGGGGKGIGKDVSNSLMGDIPFFMLRWRAASEALQMARYGITDVALGRSREKLGNELGQLSPLGFDQELKSKTEMSAKLFSQKFWTVSAESYVQAMAQTASAFDVSKVGYRNLQRMNEASIQFSMVSKMSQEKAADLVQKTILAFITGLPEEIAKKLNSGQMADVKGYGKVNLGGLSEAISAQLSKTIAVSAIWGPQIQSAFRGALPTLVDKGWDLPSALALIGSYVDVGFQPGTSGKGTKNIFEREPANFAKALTYGAGYWKSESAELDPKTRAANKRSNEIYVEKITPWVTSKLKNPDDAIQLFGLLGEIIKKAESENFDLNQFKFSKYFLPMIRQSIKKPFGERVRYLKEAIDNTSPEEAAKIAEQTMQDAGTAYQRIAGAFQNLSSTLADSSWAHRIAKAVADPLNYLTANLGFQKDVKGKSLEQIKEAWKENEKVFKALYGPEGAQNILDNAINASKGENGLRGNGWFLDTLLETHYNMMEAGGSLFERGKPVKDFYDTITLGDDLAASARQSISDFWESNISGPLKSLGDSWNYGVDWILSNGMYPFQKINELFTEIGLAVDGLKAKVAPYIPKFETPAPNTKPEEYNDMPLSERMATPFMSYIPVPMPMPSQGDQTIHIDNQLKIDSRVIAGVVAEIIQRNRDTHYHTYGSAPWGFVT